MTSPAGEATSYAGTGSAGAPAGLRASAVAGVLGFVVLAVAGLLVGLLRPADYRSTAVLAIDDPTVLSASNPAPIDKSVRLRELYGPLLTTSDVVDPVAEASGLSPTEVTKRVRAVVAQDSLLLLVTATGPSRGQARSLAQASAEQLVSYTDDVQVRAGVPAAKHVSLQVVSPAGPSVRITARTRTVLTVAGLLGLLGMIAGVVVTGRRTDR